MRTYNYKPGATCGWVTSTWLKNYSRRRYKSSVIAAESYYDYACFSALTNKPKEAIGQLDAAFQAGFKDWILVDRDKDLESVRNMPEFKALISKYREPRNK